MKAFARAISVLGLLLAIGSQAQASIVSWGVNANIGGNAITGTVTFDDASVAGFYDGYPDPSDTHVVGNFVLTSAAFGLNNTLFSNMTFQPFYYSTYGDGPHIDSTFAWGSNSLYMNEGGATIFTGDYTGTGTWSFDRAAVPVPAPIALVGLGLLAMGAVRRKQAK